MNNSDGNEALQVVASNVAISVQVAVEPTSDACARQQAHQFFEDFCKKASPTELCAVGFILSLKSEPPVILSGLQLIERVAKYQWNTLLDRQAVKEQLLNLMNDGLTSGRWPMYLQEALSKVIVEIAKREWPQLWPNLFPKLFEMAHVSDLALLVLRRMAEDVFTLQLIDCSERRKELGQSLNVSAPDVISTVFSVLVSSVQEYNASRLINPKRRGKVCLDCLLPYIEWQSSLLFTQDNRISILFALLCETEFQIEAAECIIQLLEKKSMKKEDRYDVSRICLDDKCFASLSRSIVESMDNDYLRKAGEITALLAASVADGNVNTESFFSHTLMLANKPQAVALLGSACSVNQYLKASKSSDDLTESPVGKSMTSVLTAICNKFVSAPPALEEKEELVRLKTEFSQMLRSVGKRLPKLYKEVNSWLHSSLNSPNSVQIFQWETLVLVIDAVVSTISHEDKPMIDIGLRDLEQCYSKFNQETVLELKSIILSTISALFVFLALAKQSGVFGEPHLKFMNSIFESVFQCFNYENIPYAREIRRHAAALMIKLSSKHPDLLILSFDFIHSGTVAKSAKLSSMEYNALMESLLITCNCWNDASKQCAFIRSLLSSPEWNEISSSSESLQTFVQILHEPIFLEKRIIFMKNLTLLHSVIKRVKKLQKPNGILQQSHTIENSHLVKYPESESCENEHPANDQICQLLPIVLKLVKTMHSLLDDPQLAFLMDLSAQEKSHIMGIHYGSGIQTAAGESLPPSVGSGDVDKPHPEKLKAFTLSILDTAYGILGGTCNLLAPKFYCIPQVSEAYLAFVGWNNIKISDFRLRGIIRSVFSPLLLHCPATQLEGVVKIFIQKFGPFMYDRLVNQWTITESSLLSGSDGEEMEILQNTSLRLLSKDYIDLVYKLLELKYNTSSSQTSTVTQGGACIEMEETNSVSVSQISSFSEPGECGVILMEDPVCFQSIIHLCVHAICWDDSNVSLKASKCILLSWRKLCKHTEIIRVSFGAVLRALCLWHENEANMDGLLKVIDVIFKNCQEHDPTLTQTLIEWGASAQDVQRLAVLCQGPRNEKKRKEVFRKLVLNNPALEKNRSPKAQWLRNLPKLKLNESVDVKQKVPDVDLSECFSVLHRK